MIPANPPLRGTFFEKQGGVAGDFLPPSAAEIHIVHNFPSLDTLRSKNFGARGGLSLPLLHSARKRFVYCNIMANFLETRYLY